MRDSETDIDDSNISSSSDSVRTLTSIDDTADENSSVDGDFDIHSSRGYTVAQTNSTIDYQVFGFLFVGFCFLTFAAFLLTISSSSSVSAKSESFVEEPNKNLKVQIDTNHMFGTLSFVENYAIGFSRSNSYPYASTLFCSVFTTNLTIISTVVMLRGVEDPRVIPWESGYLVTLHVYPGSRRQAAFVHNSTDCVVNENERAIEFLIDGKPQTNECEKNWMPYTSHSSKDLKMIYSIEPLIILQCDYKNIQNCSSITEQKAPIDAGPHLLRGGSNALDLTEYFEEVCEYPIIGGFGHTHIKNGSSWTYYPVFFAVEENGKDSKVIHLSKPMIFEEIFESYEQTHIAYPVCFGIHNGSAYLTINFMDSSTRIVFLSIEELVDEIKESMSQNKIMNGIKNIHQKVDKMMDDIMHSILH